MKVKRKEVFEAIQWFKTGDLGIELPKACYKGDVACDLCGKLRKEHGCYGVLVCAGDWLVNDGWLVDEESGREYNVWHPEEFEQMYECVEDK